MATALEDEVLAEVSLSDGEEGGQCPREQCGGTAGGGQPRARGEAVEASPHQG